MEIAKNKLIKTDPKKICGMVGNFVDVEGITAYRDLMYKLNVDALDVRKNAPRLENDFRAQYVFNSRVIGIDETDLLIIVGSNPRTENPVLNARIRSMVSKNGLQVYFLGSAPDITYKYQHLGNSTSVLE